MRAELQMILLYKKHFGMLYYTFQLTERLGDQCTFSQVYIFERSILRLQYRAGGYLSLNCTFYKAHYRFFLSMNGFASDQNNTPY